MAFLESFHSLRPESWLVKTCVVKTAANFEASGIARELSLHINKVLPRSFCEEDGLFDADLVHVLNPLSDLLRRFGIGVGMHINDGELCLRYFSDRNLVKRFRPIILQQNLFWRLLGIFFCVR